MTVGASEAAPATPDARAPRRFLRKFSSRNSASSAVGFSVPQRRKLALALAWSADWLAIAEAGMASARARETRLRRMYETPGGMEGSTVDGSAPCRHGT